VRCRQQRRRSSAQPTWSVHRLYEYARVRLPDLSLDLTTRHHPFGKTTLTVQVHKLDEVTNNEKVPVSV